MRSIKALSEVVYKDVDSKIRKAQVGQKKYYDQCHAVSMFKKGDLVLRKNMTNTHRMGKKLDARWLGPYKVEQITEKELHRLKCTRSGKVLKQAFSSLQLKSSICHSDAKVNAGKHIYLAFKHA